MDKKHVLNPEYLARRDFNKKLAILPDGKNTLKAGLKLAKKSSRGLVNFENARRANLEVLKLRKVESHKEIIRYVWDLNYMDFN